MGVKAGVPPGEDLVSELRAYKVSGYEQCQYLTGEDTGEEGIIEDGHRLEGAIACAPALGYEHMEMRMEVDVVPEGLDNGYHPGHDVSVGTGLHILAEGAYRREA